MDEEYYLWLISGRGETATGGRCEAPSEGQESAA